MSKTSDRKDVKITNVCRQMISLQMRPPHSDFYTEERQIRIMPGKSITLPKSHMLATQLENLKARKQITTT